MTIGSVVGLKIAVPVIIAGVLLMFLGIGQRTFWAPAGTVTTSVPAGTKAAPLTIIDAGVKSDNAQDVDITVTADGPFTLAVGRASDVDAWVADATHLRITGIGESGLETERIAGEDTVPDPSGADLWTSEETAEGSVTHRWIDPANGEWSILLAADGTAPAPTNITITQINDVATPWAVPLIIAGALALVLGTALLLTRPRGGGPAPNKREPAQVGTRAYLREQAAASSKRGTRRRFQAHPATAVAGAFAVVAALLGGPLPASVAGTGTADNGAGAPPEDAPPIVLESQLARILAAVETTVSAADAAADPKLFAPRATGGAAALRTGGYAVRSIEGDIPAPAPVAGAPVLTSMVPAGLDWPRTVVAVTKGEGNPVPQALVLIQQSPRENYKLDAAIQMLPGTTFPNSGTSGSNVLPLEEAGTLKVAPQSAVAAIADFLTSPDGANANTFEENSFADAITKFQADVVADPGNKAATISFKHSAVAENTRALATDDGGAMVFGYLAHTYSSVPKGERDSIDLKGTVYEALTGESSTEAGIDVNYGEAVMMYVPPAGSTEKIRVIGAAQQLLSAKLR